MTDRRELLEVPIFSGCRPDELRWIDKLGDTIDLPAGRVLAQQGQTAREFIVVVRGAVTAENGDGWQILGHGAHFGEVGLIDGGDHPATVVTETPVRVIVFEARAFRGLLDRAPRVARKLLGELVEKMRLSQEPRKLRAVS